MCREQGDSESICAKEGGNNRMMDKFA